MEALETPVLPLGSQERQAKAEREWQEMMMEAKSQEHGQDRDWDMLEVCREFSLRSVVCSHTQAVNHKSPRCVPQPRLLFSSCWPWVEEQLVVAIRQGLWQVLPPGNYCRLQCSCAGL